MEQLDLATHDTLASNIDFLAERFPNVVSEARAADGTLVRSVDWDQLRQEFSDRVVEGPQERYQLTWPGKREALLASNAPTARTLRPLRNESIKFDTTANLFIEGDNLDVLKLLQEPLLGKVKMIYIDPPYNTGNDFVYVDDFAASSSDYLQRSGQTDDAGARLVSTAETGGRFHSAWLSMMYPRLKVARSLLAEDGVGFVSIDGNEVAQLKLLLTEVFGAGNVVATIVWVSNLKGRQISGGARQARMSTSCASRVMTRQSASSAALAPTSGSSCQTSTRELNTSSNTMPRVRTSPRTSSTTRIPSLMSAQPRR